MERYKVITLVDITRSQPSRNETDRLKLGQQSNFNSLMQTIGLRANVVDFVDPVYKKGTLPDPFDGKAAYWTFEFTVEQDNVFGTQDNPTLLLDQDLHGVPAVDQLNNTIDMKVSVFDTKSSNMNTFVKKL